MKYLFPKASSEIIVTVFIQDSSSTTGAGLGGLDQTSNIVGGYVRAGGTGVVFAVDQNVSTEGTYEAPTSAAQVRIGTPANMRVGTHELHFHDDLFAPGADSVFITLGGATDMADLVLEIQLTDIDVNDGVRGGMTSLPNAAADANNGLVTGDGSVTFTAGVGNRPAVDVEAVSADTTAADNLELQYDTTGLTGDTFPATQSQIGNIALVGAAVSTPAKDEPNGFVIAFGENEFGDEDSTHALDGTTHNIEAQLDTATQRIDVYYEFSIGGDGLPTGVQVHSQLDKGGGAAKNLTVQALRWPSTWDTIGTLESGTSLSTQAFALFTSHVGTGANLGVVRIRYLTGSVAFSATTKLLVDQIFVEYVIVTRTVGYSGGAIWVDTGVTNTNTESFVDGTADNPVSTWAAALQLSTQLGLKKFQIANGSSITLTGDSDAFTLLGTEWTLALANRSIEGISIFGANITGIGTATVTLPTFHSCLIGAVTMPPAVFRQCGIGNASGTFTAGSAGQYLFHMCYSVVPGAAAPAFVFSGLGSATGIHNRAWTGGSTWTLDSDCTLSHEVLAGGATTITTAGGSAEVRGVTRSLTATMNAAETVQFVGVVGPVTLNGTTTATVNLYGVTGTLTDNTSAATVTLETCTEERLANLGDKSGVPRLLAGTATNSSTASKVYVEAGDPPSGGADDDYNDTLIVVWFGADKTTARVAVRAVTDYDDSDPSFTLDSALPFTPTTNHIVEVYAADSASLAALVKLSTGFGATSPDTLNAYLLAIMSKAVSAPSAAGTFSPATDSIEVLRERIDLIEGSGFATGTDSLKQIRDAIDVLVAPAVVTGTSMSGSGFLSDAVTLVRRLTDEPSTTPKYTNTNIVEFLQASFATVLAEININTDHPILVRHDITLVSDTLEYLLPPQVGEIWRVAKIVSGGYVPIYEVWPGGHMSSHQSGFVIEGNVFKLLNDWKSTDTLQILFVPLGEPSLHYGTAGAATSTSLVLASSPTDGTLDTRASSYAGYTLRILESTEGYVQERTITAYDNTTRIATISPAFDPVLTGTIKYEVLPMYSDLLKHVVCMQAALDILGIEGNKTKMQTLGQRFVVKMRALKLLIGKKSSRFPGHMDGDTSDNDARGGGYGWLA